jgi:hypothetical protein
MPHDEPAVPLETHPTLDFALAGDRTRHRFNVEAGESRQSRCRHLLVNRSGRIPRMIFREEARNERGVRFRNR